MQTSIGKVLHFIVRNLKNQDRLEFAIKYIDSLSKKMKENKKMLEAALPSSSNNMTSPHPKAFPLH